MKAPAVLVAVLLLGGSAAFADSWLQNEAFAAGNDHWYGEAKWPTDFAPPDPFTPVDPFTAQGMIIQLKGTEWVKEFQDFKGRGTDATLSLSYVVSPDLAFSQKPEDYQNVPDKMGWNAWLSFNGPPDSFIVFVSELSEQKGTYYTIHPQLKTKDVQTFNAHLTGVPWSQKTIALVFPPGQGMIVLKKVQLTDTGSNSDSGSNP